MVIHKYLFFLAEEGIKTYRAREGHPYELVKYKGETLYKGDNLDAFFLWFFKTASIVHDDRIDFCFLSEKPIESRVFSYLHDKVSSWNKKQVSEFCEKEFEDTNYQIMIDENTSCMIHQKSNIYEGAEIKKMYLKCIPDFSLEIEQESDADDGETSILCRYFMDALNKVTISGQH